MGLPQLRDVTVIPDLENVKVDLQHTIETSAATQRAEFREGNLNLIKWIVPLLIGQTAVVAALVKLV